MGGQTHLVSYWSTGSADLAPDGSFVALEGAYRDVSGSLISTVEVVHAPYTPAAEFDPPLSETVFTGVEREGINSIAVGSDNRIGIVTSVWDAAYVNLRQRVYVGSVDGGSSWWTRCHLIGRIRRRVSTSSRVDSYGRPPLNLLRRMSTAPLMSTARPRPRTRLSN